ncbi:MAG: transposase, partial [Beijerinckiaceae bacterium]
DAAMRWIAGGKAASGCAASASQMGRFKTRWLSAEKNLSALAGLSGQGIGRVHGRHPPRGIVLDMDSSVSPRHGEQEMSVWNGHHDCTCYHPLFLFNQYGDLERCALRAGSVHSADGRESVLKPVVARYRGKLSRIYFRADAGFANPKVYEYLESERIKAVFVQRLGEVRQRGRRGKIGGGNLALRAEGRRGLAGSALHRLRGRLRGLHGERGACQEE